MEKIKRLVDDLMISDNKNRFRNNKKLMLIIKASMSQLTTHRNVALYIYNLDILSRDIDLKLREKLTLENRVLIKKDPYVETYESLRQDYIKLEAQNSEYIRSIQIDLRNELLDFKLPEIYVYQGLLGIDNAKICRHIIIPGRFQTYERENDVGQIIYPINDMNSNRKFRHFYNNVSFRYLDGLTEDLSFELEGKRLGKVKIK